MLLADLVEFCVAIICFVASWAILRGSMKELSLPATGLAMIIVGLVFQAITPILVGGTVLVASCLIGLVVLSWFMVRGKEFTVIIGGRCYHFDAIPARR